MSNLNDHELFRCVRDDDDAQAFATLYDRLEPQIRRYARRLVGRDCDDIVQESFVALYQYRANVDPVERLRPYLFRITRNLCYDRLRGLQRADVVSLDEDDSVTGRPLVFDLKDERATAPDDAAHWLLVKLMVDEAIDQLPDAQREALLLYSEEGMSYAEIAVVTEASIGTVKSRIYHAKQTLRRLVHPEVLLAIQA